MDEPESLAGLSLAARDGLDTLIFVVNCNLQAPGWPGARQRLDRAGARRPVRRRRLERDQLLWGSDWDPLFARDEDGVLLKRLHETVDGEFQTLCRDRRPLQREHFFNKYPELRQIIAHMSDADIDRLRRGGHDR